MNIGWGLKPKRCAWTWWEESMLFLKNSDIAAKKPPAFYSRRQWKGMSFVFAWSQAAKKHSCNTMGSQQQRQTGTMSSSVCLVSSDKRYNTWWILPRYQQNQETLLNPSAKSRNTGHAIDFFVWAGVTGNQYCQSLAGAMIVHERCSFSCTGLLINWLYRVYILFTWTTETASENVFEFTVESFVEKNVKARIDGTIGVWQKVKTDLHVSECKQSFVCVSEKVQH